jgi:hypothetical protein
LLEFEDFVNNNIHTQDGSQNNTSSKENVDGIAFAENNLDKRTATITKRLTRSHNICAYAVIGAGIVAFVGLQRRREKGVYRPPLRKANSLPISSR